MSFLHHALNWVKGELVEAGMLALWGLMLLGMAGYFLRFGHTSTVRTLAWPFAVIGVLWGVAGAASIYRNLHRVDAFTAAYTENPVAFVEREHERVGGFIGSYRYLLIGWTVLILVGVAAFMAWGGTSGRAAGLGLILFGVAGLLVDHTSEHNAYTYKAAIEQELKNANADGPRGGDAPRSDSAARRPGA